MQALTTLSEEETMFRQEIRSFAKTVLAPKVAQMDEAKKMDPQLIQEIFNMGLMGIEVPLEHEGSAGSFFMSCLAIEELSKVDASVGVFVDVQNTLVNNIFHKWANDEQKKTYYPQLATKKVGCFCLTEADSGSDAFALRTKATEDGDDYILTGKKLFITNAGEAEIFIVFANTDFDKGYKGITAFIVEKGAQGLSLGKREDKLGIRASSTCEVVLENVRVPKKNILAPVGKGYKVAIETLNEGRIGIASQMLGLMQGAFEAAKNYAKERVQFGKPIEKFQAVQFDLARMASNIEACRLLVYNAARLKDNNLPFTREAAIAKQMTSELAEEVASKALEIFGGYGFVTEFPAEKYYRDVKIGKIYEGTSNLQLQTIFKLLDDES